MDPVVHFEIPADDVSRAQTFYQTAFGWKMNPIPEMKYTIVWTAPTDEKTRMIDKPGSINGGLMKRSGLITGPVITINVDDIQQAIRNVEKAGGKSVSEVARVGAMGLSTYVQDTEGNVIGLWQPLKPN